jgi:hypothetical protein
MELSRDKIKEIINDDWLLMDDCEGNENCDVVKDLARMALAWMEAEPVGEVSEQSDGLVMDGIVDLGGKSTHRIIKGASKMKRLPLGTKFYTAPQPLTTSERSELDNYRNAQQVVPDVMDDAGGVCCEVSYADGWNACRAAMLQAGNSPVIPDGWVMVPVEPTEDMCNVSHIGVDVYTGLARDDEYYSIGGVCAAKVYRAMLAAAPQQE